MLSEKFEKIINTCKPQINTHNTCYPRDSLRSWNGEFCKSKYHPDDGACRQRKKNFTHKKKKLSKFKTYNSGDTQDDTSNLKTSEYITEFPITHSDIRNQINNFHNQRSDGNILKSIALSQEIQRNKIYDYPYNIPSPYMSILCPVTQSEVPYCQKYSGRKCQPQTDMHSDIVWVFLFLQYFKISFVIYNKNTQKYYLVVFPGAKTVARKNVSTSA